VVTKKTAKFIEMEDGFPNLRANVWRAATTASTTSVSQPAASPVRIYVYGFPEMEFLNAISSRHFWA
jgi:hypothetical protein